MAHTVTVLAGDGIGPEVMTATLDVLEATGVTFNWDHQPIGEAAVQLGLNGLPEETMASIDRNQVAIKGPTATPLGGGHRSLNVRLREQFELGANIRPIRNFDGIDTRFSDVPIDLVIFRENLEDLYVGSEKEIWAGAEAVSRMTVARIRSIAIRAFEYAVAHQRKKVTIVHKANILKLTHGMFRDQAYDIAAKYPTVECNDLIADNCFMQLVRNPEKFDVLLTTNFVGDLMSDLCAGLIGGLGFAPGANIGDRHAIFEAVHGTAPDIAGKGIANPIALMLSGVMMLDHLGESNAAMRLRTAIETVIRADDVVSCDGRVSSTSAVAEAICLRL